MHASKLLRILPYLAGLIFAAIFAAGFEISTETAAMADAGSAIYQDSVGIQVFWLQSKACIILPPNGTVANCNYLPAIPVMVALTILLGLVIGSYGLIRKRINLVKKERFKRAD